ncbi:bZIP transcription factor 11-like [Abrus precatorius]|uniref:BZIP transcription factor 11-like n=1 Tax=Abrus precatorius TaxID=3816 RepID=A0A8B8JK33_ABRPR|nr:bZIP transcription factor 11-like [Abrus precatorius]
MASSSGNSSMCTKFQSSGSEEDLHFQLLMDQRKNKRKQSNRESARRSRARKQKHMDDLIAEVEMLCKQNSEILTRVNVTTQHYLKVEAENCILRAQVGELSQSLQSLNDIIDLINTTTTGVYQNDCYADNYYNNNNNNNNFMNPINMAYLNQPIVASADMFQW